MEKEGLVRAVQFFRKKRFKIATLVTDRHRQIANSGGSRNSKLGWPDPHLFLNSCCSLLLLFKSSVDRNKHHNRNRKETAKGMNLRMAKTK